MIVRFIAWARSRMTLVIFSSYAVLALLVLVDLAIPKHHPHFLGDMIPGFWAGFGLFSCILIILFSKWLGNKFLFRPDDYYNKYIDNVEGHDE